jgi:hypothetical protein
MKRQAIVGVALVFSATALALCECAFAHPSGSIVAWGSNTFGQLTVPPGDDFVAISAGSSCALALRSDGTLAAWADVYRVGNIWVPPGNNYVAIAGGVSGALALKSDGSLVAWGDQYPAQYRYAPPGNDFVAISATSWNLALRSDGSLVS